MLQRSVGRGSVQWFFVLFALLLVLYCSSGKNQNGPPADNGSNLKNIKQTNKSPKPIPPNQVVAHIRIISAEEKNENFLCDIKILEILETGSSAGPLAVENQINASMDKSLLKTLEDKNELFNSNQSEHIFLARLSYHKAISKDDSHNWMIIKLQKQ